MSRYPLCVLLTWCLLAAPGSAGVIFGEGVPKIQALRSDALSGRLPVSKLRWVDHKGRTVEQRLPFPVDLLDGPRFLAPAGEWTDLELVLEGPATLTLAGERCALDLETLAVPLELPARGGQRVEVEIALPDGLRCSGLEAALRDGALGRVEQGNPDDSR